jgi:hypothetical protein
MKAVLKVTRSTCHAFFLFTVVDAKQYDNYIDVANSTYPFFPFSCVVINKILVSGNDRRYFFDRKIALVLSLGFCITWRCMRSHASY